MLRSRLRSAAVFAAWLVLMFAFAPAALAQGEGERVGENLGDLLGGWARHLYLGIAARGAR